jgi:hypothetical protein
VLAYLGLEDRYQVPPGQGESLLPLLRGYEGYRPRPRYAICKLHQKCCIVYGWYKYVLDASTPEAKGSLIDLLTDPDEVRDMSERWPGLAATLRDALSAFISTAPDLFAGESQYSPTQDEQHRRQLEALGYL